MNLSQIISKSIFQVEVSRQGRRRYTVKPILTLPVHFQTFSKMAINIFIIIHVWYQMIKVFLKLVAITPLKIRVIFFFLNICPTRVLGGENTTIQPKRLKLLQI